MQNHTCVGRGRPKVLLFCELWSRATCSRRRAKVTLPQARGANAHLMALTTWCLSCSFAAICGRLLVNTQHELQARLVSMALMLSFAHCACCRMPRNHTLQLLGLEIDEPAPSDES